LCSFKDKGSLCTHGLSSANKANHEPLFSPLWNMPFDTNPSFFEHVGNMYAYHACNFSIVLSSNCTFTYFFGSLVILFKAKHSLSHRPLFKVTVFIVGFGFTYYRHSGVITRAWTMLAHDSAESGSGLQTCLPRYGQVIQHPQRDCATHRDSILLVPKPLLITKKIRYGREIV
jgi:hypothetical protein